MILFPKYYSLLFSRVQIKNYVDLVNVLNMPQKVMNVVIQFVLAIFPFSVILHVSHYASPSIWVRIELPNANRLLNKGQIVRAKIDYFIQWLVWKYSGGKKLIKLIPNYFKFWPIILNQILFLEWFQLVPHGTFIYWRTVRPENY